MKKRGQIRIIIAVSNDLEGDQRLHKVAVSLQKKGWEPVLLGRRLADSKALNRPYKTIRLRLLFNKGPLFYLCLNFRIFLFLLFRRSSLMVSNDLDTLPGVWMASIIRGKPVIYDSHEYFTQVPELVRRPCKQRIWKFIERRIQPRLKYLITVNDSIAGIFSEEYGQEFTVVKNLPSSAISSPPESYLPAGFTGRPVLIYQGAVNEGRGLEEMIAAMPLMPEFHFLIAGGGDKLGSLKQRVSDMGLESRVYFTGRVPFETLSCYTGQASIGLSLEQDAGLNYRLSLPNKLFDYMQAGLPVVASDLPEIRKLISRVGFGILVSDFSPEGLSGAIRSVWQDKIKYMKFVENARAKAPEYTWEKQETLLWDVYNRALARAGYSPD